MDAAEASEARRPLLVRATRHHYSARQLFLADIVAVAIAGTTTATVVDQHPTVGGTGWAIVLWGAGIVASGAVLFRRRYPRSVVGVLAVLTVLFLATGLLLPLPLYLVMGIYTYVAGSERTESLVVTAFIAVVECAVVVAAGGSHDLPASTDSINQLCLAGVAWFAGDSAKNARQYATDQRERQAERAAAAEVERNAEIRRAVSEERTTIARELHDVVAHAMSIVTVRAGVGRMVIDSRPDQAREALEIIEATSRRSLQEMRLLVGVLRQGEEGRPELAPAPGLGDLPRVVADVATAGVKTTVRVEGVRRPLPASVDLTAYRIIREALTNVVRHAGTTTAAVVIDYRPDELAIEVTDEGPKWGTRPVDQPSGGHGLIGMRERAAIFGGTLESGPRGAGFRVRTVLSTRDIDVGVTGN